MLARVTANARRLRDAASLGAPDWPMLAVLPEVERPGSTEDCSNSAMHTMSAAACTEPCSSGLIQAGSCWRLSQHQPNDDDMWCVFAA